MRVGGKHLLLLKRCKVREVKTSEGWSFGRNASSGQATKDTVRVCSTYPIIELRFGDIR